MTLLAVLRHLPTGWNLERRLQGRADIPILPVETVIPIPLDLKRWRVVASPLARTMETARLRLGTDPLPEPVLIEMDWGAFEGRKLADLRRELGEELVRNEACGLDFTPPDGESPRDIQRRLATWLPGIGRAGQDVFAVTHKGVIRALYALATGWDMRTAAPDRLDWSCPQLFSVDGTGKLAVERLNLAAGDLA